jgi:DNA-binding LytR/AlgR family response regulator
MYHIAIVEDEIDFSAQLQNYLKEYQNENGVEFKISVFQDGADILKDYHSEYDAIFLDIEMPEVNGMEAAEKIREMDEDVVLMFITNMAQYALFGYSVGAADFFLVFWCSFCLFSGKERTI